MMDQDNARVAVHTFTDRAQADAVIRALQSAGFSNDQINVVARDRGDQRDIADEHHVGAGTGATIGVVEGAIIGLLAGIGGLLVPGIGAVAAVGPIAGLIAGGVTGGIAGALAGWGIDAAEAKGYEERVGAGDVLVAVRDDDPTRVAEARRIMDGTYDTQAGTPADTTMAATGGTYDTAGATSGSPAGTLPGATMAATGGTYDRQAGSPAGTPTGTTGTTMAATAATTPDADVRRGEDVRVPVVEEELVADKQVTEQGRVRLRKDVVEEQQQIDVPVTREEVRVERVPVSGDYDASTADAFQEKDIEVPLKREEAVAEKRARVTEEVRLSKDVITENQQVSDTVRKERVVVDDSTLADGGVRTTAGRGVRSTGDIADDDTGTR